MNKHLWTPTSPHLMLYTALDLDLYTIGRNFCLCYEHEKWLFLENQKFDS